MASVSKFDISFHPVFRKKQKPMLEGLDKNYEGVYAVIHEGRVLVFYSDVALHAAGHGNVSEGLRLL